MYISKKKILSFQSEGWYFGDRDLYYISRLPQTDFLAVQKEISSLWKYTRKVVKISDFIMAHPTNRKRSDAAYFVFHKLEWHDEICIRSAYELNKIKSDPDYARSSILDGNSLRIIRGEVWTHADYQIERILENSTICDRPFEDYPELGYGILSLPPYLDPRDSKIHPLVFKGWNSEPKEIEAQIDFGCDT